jgi:peptidyl-prolyl cis-trans isomerase B (cyclophilin B)
MTLDPLSPGQYPPSLASRPTNSLAIASVVCTVLFPPLAVVFGHIALYQIKRSGDDGRGVAIVGLVLGYTFTILLSVLLITVVVVLCQFTGTFAFLGMLTFLTWLFPSGS